MDENNVGLGNISIATRNPRCVECSAFKMIWTTKAILKALILGWKQLLDKLPTKNKLLVKGIQLQNNLCEL